MHAVVVESLEEYLSGTLKPENRRDVEAHLSICEPCRQEVAGMREISGLFSAMAPDEVIEPSPGFCARVMQEVEARKPVPTFAGLFGLGIGGVMTLLPMAWADYFGRESYGAIRGVALSLQVLAQAAGPLASGLLRDASGKTALDFARPPAPEVGARQGPADPGRTATVEILAAAAPKS